MQEKVLKRINNLPNKNDCGRVHAFINAINVM